MSLYDDNIRYPDSGINVKTIDLEILKRGLTQAISRELIYDKNFGTPVTVDIDENSAFYQLVVRTTVYELGKQRGAMVTTASESVPVAWWDHLLISIGLKKYAKTRTITTRATIYRTCPHLNIPIRNERDRNTHLTFLMNVDEERGRRA